MYPMAPPQRIPPQRRVSLKRTHIPTPAENAQGDASKESKRPHLEQDSGAGDAVFDDECVVTNGLSGLRDQKDMREEGSLENGSAEDGEKEEENEEEVRLSIFI